MAENQTQPRTEGLDNPQGGPVVRKEDPAEAQPRSDRPSDLEAAHAPEEGRPFDVSPGRTDPTASPGRGRDPRPDYGRPTGHSLAGTDEKTAGAEFADRLPEASKTSADQAGTKPD